MTRDEPPRYPAGSEYEGTGGLDVEQRLLDDAAKWLALRPSGHTGSMADRIPWFTHSGVSHGEDRPDCVVCQWLAEYDRLSEAER